MSPAKSFRITFLRTLSEGVRCPLCSVKSPGSTRKRRTASARDTALFASSTAPWSSASNSGASLSSAMVALVLRELGLPDLHRLLVQRDQAGHVGPAVAHHQDLAYQRVGADPVLQHRRRDVLAARRHDQFLLAPGYPQEPVLVEFPDVPGAQPAVGHHFRGGRFVAPVTSEDGR